MSDTTAEAATDRLGALVAWLLRHRFDVVLWVAWAVLSTVARLHHEPWRDEADPWLYARDQSWDAFVEGGRYAGTPVLWFLVQAALARNGFSYEALSPFHWLIAATAMGWFVFRAPLPRLARVAFALSFFGVFEYAVVARSYALTLLFTWAACATWSSRAKLPWHFVWLALLAQTNLPGLFFAAAIGVVGLGAGRMRTPAAIGGAALAVASGMFAVWQVRPPEDGQKVDVAFALALSDGAGWAVSHGFFPWGPTAVRTVIAGMLLALLLVSLWRRRVALAVYLWIALPFCVLFTSVHQGHLRHFGFLLVALVVAAWIDGAEASAAGEATARHTWLGARALTPALAIVLVLGPWAVFGAGAIKDEVTSRFSNSTAMADYLARRDLLHRRFALSEGAVAVAPWLPAERIWYPALLRHRTFLPWDAKQVEGRTLSMHELGKRTRNAFSHLRSGAQPLLLLTSPLVRPWRLGYKLLHAEAEEVWSSHGESLYLYAPQPLDKQRNVKRPRR